MDTYDQAHARVLMERSKATIRNYQEIPPTCDETKGGLWWAKMSLTFWEAVLKLPHTYPDDLPYPGDWKETLRAARAWHG